MIIIEMRIMITVVTLIPHLVWVGIAGFVPIVINSNFADPAM